jgi:hypothetical protein
LPEYKGTVSVLHAIIRKLPDSLAAKRDDLRDKLYEHEAIGLLPWTTEQLISILAVHLGGTNLETNLGERPSKKPDDRQSKGCLNCGSVEHELKTCKAKCPSCSIPFCPGTHKGSSGCVVKTSKDVPKDVKNATGKQVATHLAAHRERRGQRLQDRRPEHARRLPYQVARRGQAQHQHRVCNQPARRCRRAPRIFRDNLSSALPRSTHIGGDACNPPGYTLRCPP